MTIDELIAKIARAGNFSHLSLASTWDGKWHASFRDVDSHEIKQEVDRDPLVALRKVLSRAKAVRPKPQPKRRLLIDEDLL